MVRPGQCEPQVGDQGVQGMWGVASVDRRPAPGATRLSRRPAPGRSAPSCAVWRGGGRGRGLAGPGWALACLLTQAPAQRNGRFTKAAARSCSLPRSPGELLEPARRHSLCHRNAASGEGGPATAPRRLPVLRQAGRSGASCRPGGRGALSLTARPGPQPCPHPDTLEGKVRSGPRPGGGPGKPTRTD